MKYLVISINCIFETDRDKKLKLKAVYMSNLIESGKTNEICFLVEPFKRNYTT